MGDLEAIPLRDAWTGNRGTLHSGREIARFHAGDLWITCELRFRERWQEANRRNFFDLDQDVDMFQSCVLVTRLDTGK